MLSLREVYVDAKALSIKSVLGKFKQHLDLRICVWKLSDIANTTKLVIIRAHFRRRRIVKLDDESNKEKVEYIMVGNASGSKRMGKEHIPQDEL